MSGEKVDVLAEVRMLKKARRIVDAVLPIADFGLNITIMDTFEVRWSKGFGRRRAWPLPRKKPEGQIIAIYDCSTDTPLWIGA